MIRIEKNNLVWLQFELLADCHKLVHGIFTRHGGVSQKPFDSLNVSKHVGDLIENVNENRQKILEHFPISQCITANQCHSDEIASITSAAITEFPKCDALTTQCKDVGLMIQHADCQAAIFYDPIQQAVSNVHCGWRGSIQNIYRKTVQKMQQDYGSLPENLLVCISPSLGPDSAEFINYKAELPKEFWKFKNEVDHFNFWEISRWQLSELGVLPHHIQIAEIDTYQNPEDFFSYRRSNSCGRNATICALNSN